MGRACGTYRRQVRCIKVLVRRPEGKITVGRLRRKERIILKWIFKQWDEGMDWIGLAQDRDR